MTYNCIIYNSYALCYCVSVCIILLRFYRNVRAKVHSERTRHRHETILIGHHTDITCFIIVFQKQYACQKCIVYWIDRIEYSVVQLTSFFGTYLVLFCLLCSLELGIILLDFGMTVVDSTSIRLSTTASGLWDSVLPERVFWGFGYLSTEGLSTDGSVLFLSDL